MTKTRDAMTNKSYLSHYLILLSLLAFSLFFFVYFGFNRAIQAWSVVAVSFSYFLWGIIHHYQRGDLYWKVVVEYFLLALLGAILVITLIFRA